MGNLSLYACLLIVSSLLTLCNAAEYKKIPYKNCKSNFEILSVEATECAGDFKYCPFRKGSEPRIRIAFKPNRQVDALETSVRAKVGVLYVPFQVDEKDACKGGNLTCPLIPGNIYYYSQSVKILDVYPKISVQVNWLVNEKNKVVTEASSNRDLCLFFLAKVVD